MEQDELSPLPQVEAKRQRRLFDFVCLVSVEFNLAFNVFSVRTTRPLLPIKDGRNSKETCTIITRDTSKLKRV